MLPAGLYNQWKGHDSFSDALKKWQEQVPLLAGENVKEPPAKSQDSRKAGNMETEVDAAELSKLLVPLSDLTGTQILAVRCPAPYHSLTSELCDCQGRRPWNGGPRKERPQEPPRQQQGASQRKCGSPDEFSDEFFGLQRFQSDFVATPSIRQTSALDSTARGGGGGGWSKKLEGVISPVSRARD
eukprot:1888379-Amphidinium_carterae.1